MKHKKYRSFHRIQHDVIRCTACPRLVEWRENIGKTKTRRFREDEYWSKPVPAFGSPDARLLIVGLAPAAHGANRTGRMFTGDRSGEWLYRALNKFGFANQAESIHLNDGLELNDCLVTAVCRCAPPANKPTPSEIDNCRRYLFHELRLLNNVRVILALGGIAFEQTLKTYSELAKTEFKPRPKFKHLEEVTLSSDLRLIASFHPSQQNTFTKRLTEPMFDQVFERARRMLAKI